MFESPTSFKDETTAADKLHMTYENFSQNYGHNFQNVFFYGGKNIFGKNSFFPPNIQMMLTHAAIMNSI